MASESSSFCQPYVVIVVAAAVVTVVTVVNEVQGKYICGIQSLLVCCAEDTVEII